jgi:alpha-beta hydrolase superfamily lysophospholipase
MAINWLKETDHGDRVCREFTLEGTPRLVSGALWLNPSVPVQGLICLGHGASGDRHQQPIPHLAKRLTAQGLACLSIDGPVHGRRKVGDGARGAFWPEWRREGSVPDMLEDWEAAISAVRDLPDVGQKPFGYWGLSMGTIFGAPLVAAHPECAGAVLGLMGITGPDHFRPLITRAAEQIQCPVLFIQQLEDELFTRDEYLALFDALGSTDKRLHANPGLHPQVPPEELDFCVDFLTRNLLGTPADRTPVFKISE